MESDEGDGGGDSDVSEDDMDPISLPDHGRGQARGHGRVRLEVCMHERGIAGYGRR